MILLLASEPVVRKVLKEVLEEAGYVVQATGNLAGAVKMMAAGRMELLIVRPYVDNMIGHQAASYLQKKDPHMRVLIVAGLVRDDRLEYREELATFEIFPQPFTAAEFLKKVGQILKG